MENLSMSFKNFLDIGSENLSKLKRNQFSQSLEFLSDTVKGRNNVKKSNTFKSYLERSLSVPSENIESHNEREVSALIEKEEVYLEKLQSVLNQFEEKIHDQFLEQLVESLNLIISKHKELLDQLKNLNSFYYGEIFSIFSNNDILDSYIQLYEILENINLSTIETLQEVTIFEELYFIGEQFRQYSIFFVKLKSHNEEITTQPMGNDLKYLTTALEKFQTKINTFKKGRDLIQEIVDDQVAYLKEIQDTYTIISNNLNCNKYYHKSSYIMGDLLKILEEEKLLLEDLNRHKTTFDPDKITSCYFRHKQLFDFYEEDAKKKTIKTIIVAFCRDKKIDECYIQFIPNHLVHLKIQFEKLISYQTRIGIEETSLQIFVDLLHEKIKSIDIISSITSIAGIEINFEKQGNPILRQRFKVKHDRNTFEAVIFLLEKFIFITKEETILNGLNDYVLYGSIPIDTTIKFVDSFKDQLTISSGTKNIYVISSSDLVHGKVDLLRKHLLEIVKTSIIKSRNKRIT